MDARALRRGRGRGRGNRLRNRLQNPRKQHIADYRGIVALARFDPPRVLSTPWNQLVTTFRYTNGTSAANHCFSVADLAIAFRTQCGLPTSVNVGFRIMSAQVWHLTPNGELNNIVRVRFMSLIEGITACDLTDTLAQLEDYGTPTRPASVKFIWPKTHSSNTFSSISNRIFMRTTNGAAQVILIHVSVLWKFYGDAGTLFNDNEFVSEINSPFSSLSLCDTAHLRE